MENNKNKETASKKAPIENIGIKKYKSPYDYVKAHTNKGLLRDLKDLRYFLEEDKKEKQEETEKGKK